MPRPIEAQVHIAAQAHHRPLDDPPLGNRHDRLTLTDPGHLLSPGRPWLEALTADTDRRHLTIQRIDLSTARPTRWPRTPTSTGGRPPSFICHGRPRKQPYESETKRRRKAAMRDRISMPRFLGEPVGWLATIIPFPILTPRRRSLGRGGVREEGLDDAAVGAQYLACTTTSTTPKVSTAASNTAETATSSATSACTVIARAPLLSMTSTAASASVYCPRRSQRPRSRLRPSVQWPLDQCHPSHRSQSPRARRC